eukprot:1209391-Rhodomonas_salina.3
MLAEALVAALDEPKHTSPKGSMCQSFSGNGNHPGIHAPREDGMRRDHRKPKSGKEGAEGGWGGEGEGTDMTAMLKRVAGRRVPGALSLSIRAMSGNRKLLWLKDVLSVRARCVRASHIGTGGAWCHRMPDGWS